MKPILCSALIAALCFPSSLHAEPYPQLLRLQGHFTDTRIPLTDRLPVRFSIWDSADGYGNLLWEDVENVDVKEDSFLVVLGRTKALTPSVFSGGDRWVEMQLGSDPPMRPRHKIPGRYIQAQAAAAQPAPAPVAAPVVAAPPPAPVTAPVATPPATPPAPAVAATPTSTLTDQEKRELELQIEKWRIPSVSQHPRR